MTTSLTGVVASKAPTVPLLTSQSPPRSGRPSEPYGAISYQTMSPPFKLVPAPIV